MSFSSFMEVAKDFAQAYYPLVALVTTVIGFAFGLKTGFWSRDIGKIADFWRTDIRALKTRNAELTEKLQRVRDAFHDDNNLWLRTPVMKPPRYNSDLQ